MLRLKIIMPVAGLLFAAAACAPGGGTSFGLQLDGSRTATKCTGAVNVNRECDTTYNVTITNPTGSEIAAPELSLSGEGKIDENDCADPIPAGESCTATVEVTGAPGSSQTLLATSGLLSGTINLPAVEAT